MNDATLLSRTYGTRNRDDGHISQPMNWLATPIIHLTVYPHTTKAKCLTRGRWLATPIIHLTVYPHTTKAECLTRGR
ncbi:MAG: hypothetical protein IKJ81_00650 [Bacteroidales bacterium]|nr:hypothetical protein [Bacteroidales bacterium]